MLTYFSGKIRNWLVGRRAMNLGESFLILPLMRLEIDCLSEMGKQESGIFVGLLLRWINAR